MIQLEKVIGDNCKKWNHKEHIFEKVNGEYIGITYGDFLEQTRSLASYLLSRGLKKKSILIYGNNSCKYMMADLAVLHYVGISVCVSKEWKEAELKQAIELLDISCVLYGEDKRDVINEVAKDCAMPIYISMDEAFTEAGNCTYDVLEQTEDESCCKIIFSSGTTSNPKAVMLSKKNLFAGIDSMYRRCPFNENDVDYLCLPLSHTYAGIYNFLYSMVFGFSIYLCSDNATMAQEILEVNPTLFCGVPLIYKRFYEGYGSHIAKAFGSRIKYLFCGGALMDENIRRAYKDSGLNMMEAYALSETASTFAIQYPYDPDVKTVGTIAEDIDVKILNADEDGIAYLTHYSQDYLTEKEEERFAKLCECTDGSHLVGEFDKDGNIDVYGNENAYHTCYDYNYPAVDVYREMLWKMHKDMNYYMMGLKVNSYSDFRVWKSDDYLGYMTLDIFADDYGIEINKGFDYCKGWYIDVVGNE